MIPTEPEKGKTSDIEAGVEPNDIETSRKMLTEEQEKAEKYLANWQKAEANLINYKRQVELEKQESSKFANATLILSILPVLDDFERALSSLSVEQSTQPWVEGFKLIRRKLHIILEMQGLTEIKAKGEPFDPRFHEAVRQDKGKENIVIQEIQKGYMFKNRLLRASKVVVGNGEFDN
ncbi:MAG: nucleotide exchange factor GrpE [Chloroflexi bacterium]|nr:nucleotide exchange factor GrpE [Chloroflexota bacterium]